MKKRVFLAVLFFYPFFAAFSNDAYTRVSGGAVLPLSKTKNQNIKMEKEEINFTLYKDYYDINVKFYFKNYGPSETIEVGFPQWKDRLSSEDDFYSFSGKVNGQNSDFIIKELNPPEALNEHILITKWYIRPVSFESDEMTSTEVQYSAPYGVYGISSSADYLYGTGATWKDCIGEMILTIRNTTDEIWINGIEFDGQNMSDIQRNQDFIRITKKNVYPKLESKIFLTTDHLPECLVSLKVIDPERRWFFRENLINQSQLTCCSDFQLRVLHDLMFAAYGNIFESEDINSWLEKNCLDWYEPKQKVTEDTFNEKERKNLGLIDREISRRKK